MSDTSTSLVVVRVGPQVDASSVKRQMEDVVEGALVSMDELSNITDWTSLRKVCHMLRELGFHLLKWSQYYKLNTDPAVSALAQNIEKQHVVGDELVTSFVAMKSVMS